MAPTIPQSEVAICNLALDHLKQAPITALEGSNADQVSARCARWYPQTRRATLRIHPWNFAMTRIQVTPSLDYEPPFGFTHAYLKPNGFVRFIEFCDADGRSRRDQSYDMEGEYFLANGEDNESINMRFIKDIEDVSKFDPLFVQLFALDLAIILAPNFSSSEARVRTLMSLRQEALSQATAIDGQERPPRRVQRSKFIESRHRASAAGAGEYTNFY